MKPTSLYVFSIAPILYFFYITIYSNTDITKFSSFKHYSALIPLSRISFAFFFSITAQHVEYLQLFHIILDLHFS